MLDKDFFNTVRESLFNGSLTQGTVDTLNAIAGEAKAAGVVHKAQLAYTFATAYHEAYSAARNPEFAPVREGFTKTNAGAVRAVTSLFNRGIISVNYALPDKKGRSYYGRGYVQITWPKNYITLGKKLNLPLYEHPDLALDRDVAAKILVLGMRDGLFTGKDLNDYINDKKVDYKQARRIINGVDCADKIAGYATKFYQALN